MSARANKKAIVDTSRLNGPEKAAIVLLALGEDHNTIWQQLDEEEIKEVSQAMAGLGTVSAQVVWPPVGGDNSNTTPQPLSSWHAVRLTPPPLVVP